MNPLKTIFVYIMCAYQNKVNLFFKSSPRFDCCFPVGAVEVEGGFLSCTAFLITVAMS